MENWKTVRLGDVCEKGSSNIAQNEITDNNGEYPIYGAAGFIKNVDFYKQDKPYIGIVKDGAGVGRVSVHPAKSSLIGTMQYIFPKENIDIKFLAEFLKYQNLSRFYTGATIPHIYFKDYQNIPLKLPSLQKQKHISAVLDKCTALITKHKLMLEKYDTLIKSRFIEMFGDNPVESGKWEVETLADVCSSVVRGPFGSALKKDVFVPKSNNTVKVYEQKHAIQKSANIGTYYISQEKYEELKRFECKPGDFIMSCSGTMGEFYQLPIGCEKGIINQALCKFSLNNKIEALFFLEWMKQSIHNLETKGSGIQNVAAVSFIKQMPVFLPPLTLQNDFASFVQQIDKSKFAVQKSLEKTETLYKSLMQQYFG